jgi:serine/threonine protein kinase
MNDIRQHEVLELDEFVEAYEARLADTGSARLADFLPRSGHPDFARIVGELIRVDMECAWTRGQPKRIADYRHEFPELLNDSAVVTAIAYEEFRQRRQAGEEVSHDEYAQNYAIDVSDWPVGSFSGSKPGAAARHKITDSGIPCAVAWEDRSTQPGCRAEDCRDSAAPVPSQSHLFDVPDLLAGGRFAGCEIVRELGRGASSRVYLARQQALADRPVILKVTPGRTAEPDYLARLQHTNIVPIYSVHQVGGLQALCMPYFGASTLGHWVRQLRDLHNPRRTVEELASTVALFRSGTWRPRMAEPFVSAQSRAGTLHDNELHTGGQRFPRTAVSPADQRCYETAMLALALPLARALAHAHEQEIMHLDLKPANILLTDDGRPMLLDFHLGSAGDASWARSKVIGGTLPYMSPEQIRSLEFPEPIDLRTDIYSFGVVLYELLTGQLPFPARNGAWEALLPAMLSDRRQVPSPNNKQVLVSPAVAAIIGRCLAPDRERRYKSADELAADLECQQRDLPLRFAGNPSIRERFSKWIRRHPRATSAGAVSAAALFVLSIGAAAWAVRGEKLATLEAHRVYVEFTSRAPEAKALLSLPIVDSSDLSAERSRAKRVLQPLGSLDSAGWTSSKLMRRLSSDER